MLKALALVLALVTPLSHAKTFVDASWPARRDPTPEWFSKPDVVIDVRWTRSASSPSFLFAGVCHLFYSDISENAMDIADGQIDRCEKQSKFQKIPLTTTNPDKDVSRVHIYKAKNQTAVEDMFQELFAQAPHQAKSVGLPSLAFYYKADGVCSIVTYEGQTSLGHELKHCFDGAWHNR